MRYLAQRERQALVGADAVAVAMLQVNPDVVAAYPITPQTGIVQTFASFVADGLTDTEMVQVESEHSAMSAVIGAAAAGARAMTATSANGLALMWEVVYIAASLRLPIVMPVVNRALSGNINIHCDHSDSMGARDSGWIQIFCEDSQQAYDSTIQAVKIAERCLLPVMVCLDGFIISHAIEAVDLLADEEVAAFVGEYRPRFSLLDVEHPVTFGPLDLQDFYFEHKRSEIQAVEDALPVVEEVGAEFGRLSGRSYGLFEAYRLDDAEIGAVILGSTAGTAKVVVDVLREKGVKAGLLALRLFRPFPARRLVEALSHLKALAVLDRSSSPGALGGPVFTELRSAFYESEKKPPMVNYIYGLGGRDVGTDQIETVYRDLAEIASDGKVEGLVRYLGLRE